MNFRPLRERNFALSCIIIFCSFGVLYGSSTLLPGMLEALFGYVAFHAGLVLSPSGIFTILAIIIVGALLGCGVDARWLIATGLLIVAAGNFWMSLMNLDIAPGQVVWVRVVMVAGLGLVFAPVNVAAYLYMPRALRGAAVGLLALLRNETIPRAATWSMADGLAEPQRLFNLAKKQSTNHNSKTGIPKNAEAQTWKQQLGSFGYRARLHGHELLSRPRRRQECNDSADPQSSGAWRYLIRYRRK